MGRGRARLAAVAGAIGALALAATGCGAQTHPNEPRPQVSLHVSVKIGPREVIVQPPEIATGPERTQQIPQNMNDPQPPIKGAKGPIDVTLVAANETGSDARLRLRGPKDASSGPIYAHSPGTMQTALPSGTYTIAASGVPGARPGKLVVGRYHASSENDVLLP
jgi:hypothetical protein